MLRIGHCQGGLLAARGAGEPAGTEGGEAGERAVEGFLGGG